MKKPLNYYGFAFDKPGKGYNKDFLKTEKGKKEIKKEKKSKKRLQKQLKKNGFDASECWNLDVTIAKFVLPRLKYLRKNTHGYPPTLTMKEWKATIKKMEKSFKIDVKDKTNADWDAYQEGMDLFAKYFRQLWD